MSRPYFDDDEDYDNSESKANQHYKDKQAIKAKEVFQKLKVKAQNKKKADKHFREAQYKQDPLDIQEQGEKAFEALGDNVRTNQIERIKERMKKTVSDTFDRSPTKEQKESSLQSFLNAKEGSESVQQIKLDIALEVLKEKYEDEAGDKAENKVLKSTSIKNVFKAIVDLENDSSYQPKPAKERKVPSQSNVTTRKRNVATPGRKTDVGFFDPSAKDFYTRNSTPNTNDFSTPPSRKRNSINLTPVSRMTPGMIREGTESIVYGPKKGGSA